jgi:nitric oxide synthase oxygenase domain/subunit
MRHSTHHQSAMKHVADTTTTADALMGAMVDSHHKAMESHHTAFEKHVTDTTITNISASVIQWLPPDVAAAAITQYAVSEDNRDKEPFFAYFSVLLI